MFAFIVNDSGLRVVRLGDRQKISAAAADLHDRLLDPESPRSDIRTSARQLAELVLWPLTAQLGAKRLIFVPDEGLHTIPFNILPWSPTATDQLVLQHAEVAIVPSALFLTRVQANMPARVGAPRVELLGDPVFRIADWNHECADSVSGQKTARTTRAASDWTESLPRLPGSRAEVQMVARLTQQTWPSSHVETLLGCAAVPSATFIVGAHTGKHGGPEIRRVRPAGYSRIEVEYQPGRSECLRNIAGTPVTGRRRSRSGSGISPGWGGRRDRELLAGRRSGDLSFYAEVLQIPAF
jgi:hypothetical protein